jgi:hypothetical protein
MTIEEIQTWKQALYEREQAALDESAPIVVDESILEKIQALSKCRFLPASFDKRFARSMANKALGDELSPRQAKQLDRIFHRYRRQHGMFR